MAARTRRPAGAEAARRTAGRHRAGTAPDHRTGPADLHVRARSGLRVDGFPDQGRDLRAPRLQRGIRAAPEPDEWMRRLGELPLQYQPGVRWQYDLSNEVVGVLVSRVTGRSLETFLRERVLDPLGMKDTAFHVPADKIDRLPPLYGPDPQTGEFLVWDEAAGGRAGMPPRSRAPAAGWSPPPTTTTPTSGCC
nr:serine hydrolase domain-containing protein [Streptomyces sp. NBC_00162]